MAGRLYDRLVEKFGEANLFIDVDNMPAGADFVKTSTGFSTGGATVHDIALMRGTVGPRMGVKASGGIRTLEDVQKMVAAGATRIGASAGVKIVEEAAGGHAASESQSGY